MPAGTYTAVQSVSLSDTTPGATIYYTTNGSAPTTGSTMYTGAIRVSASETIQAIAVAAGDTNSAKASATYVINMPLAATPAFSVQAGTYGSAQTVTLSDATPQSIIFYTINGATPTISSTQYSGAISVAASETIKAIATARGYANSAVASAAYSIFQPAATPIFSVKAGVYGPAQTVALSDSTSGATIYYTTSGTTPNSGSAKYTRAIAVTANETISAIALAPGHLSSVVNSATYTIVGAPIAQSAPATAVSTSGATLNAVVNTVGLTGTYLFQYGTKSTAMTSKTATVVRSASTTPVAASAQLPGLKSKTTYFYQVSVTTSGGTTNGATVSFTTN